MNIKAVKINKKWKLIIGFLSLIGIFSATLVITNILQDPTKTVYAQEIVEKSVQPDTALKLVGTDEAVYYETVTYQRSNLAITEPPDPYHLPILPFYRGAEFTQYWGTADGYVKTTALNDDREQLLTKFIKKPDSRTFYNAITNQVLVIPMTNVQGEVQLSEHDTGWIDSEVISEWGRTAWVVKFKPRTVSPEEFSLQPQRLISQSQEPFAEDLHFTEIQWTWVIDQETELLVSQSLVALTSPDPTLLYSEVRGKPEILPITDLPSGWNELPPDAQISLEGNHSESEFITVNEVEKLAESLISAFNFPIYLPNTEAFTLAGESLDKAYLFHNTTFAETPLTLAFEATQIGESRYGLKVIYFNSAINDSEHPQAIALVQAPRAETVTKLQHSLPLWHESRPVQVMINNQPIDAWVVWGGVMRDVENDPLIGMFVEIEETFIYLEGQNVSESRLIESASSLQEIKP